MRVKPDFKESVCSVLRLYPFLSDTAALTKVPTDSAVALASFLSWHSGWTELIKA